MPCFTFTRHTQRPRAQAQALRENIARRPRGILRISEADFLRELREECEYYSRYVSSSGHDIAFSVI